MKKTRKATIPASGDLTIAAAHDSKTVVLNQPRGAADRNNFLILWNGMDWSGFRTLADCLTQFEGLAAKVNGREYSIVERF